MSKYNRDTFFSVDAIRAFVEREAVLRGNTKWPNTHWYNDEDFCELYRQAIELYHENAALQKELLKWKDHCSGIEATMAILKDENTWLQSEYEEKERK